MIWCGVRLLVEQRRAQGEHVQLGGAAVAHREDHLVGLLVQHHLRRQGRGAGGAVVADGEGLAT
jgi:hypothetical protein